MSKDRKCQNIENFIKTERKILKNSLKKLKKNQKNEKIKKKPKYENKIFFKTQKE